MPEATAPRSRLGLVGLVTVVGSAFLGFNTLVTSCASEIVTRNAAQLHASEESEKFWTEAMKDLSELVKDKDQPASNYEARCKLLARRTAPFSTTEPLPPEDAGGTKPPPELAVLSGRVGNLQAEFARQIRDPAIVGPRCSSEFDQRQQVDQRQKDIAKEIASDVAVAAKSDVEVPFAAIVARKDLINLSGLSAKGIDVDIYWCDSTDENQAGKNYKGALLLGQRLADYAVSGRKLTFARQSDPVGQVRVRILPRALLVEGSEYAKAAGHNVLTGPANVQPFLRAIATDASQSGIAGLGSWMFAAPGFATGRWQAVAAICGSGRDPSATAPET